MKKVVFQLFFIILITAVTTVLLSAAAIVATGVVEAHGASAQAPEVSINVDGKELITDVPPQIINGRTLIPVRAVSEAIGCEVEWVSEGQLVVVHLPGGGSKLTLQINNTTARAVIESGGDGAIAEVSTEIDSPPILVDGRTLVPIRFVAEFIGFEVDWDAASRTVLLYSPLYSS